MRNKMMRFGKLAVALMVLLSAIGGAAAITFDTETTTTTTQSDISGTSTTATWYTANSSERLWIETDNANSSALRVEFSSAGATFYTNSTVETLDATNGHYAFNLSHAELAEELPSAWDNSTYQVKIYNSTTDAELLSTELTLSKADSDDVRVFVAGASENSSAQGNSLLAHNLDVQTDEPGFIMSLLGGENQTTSTFEDSVMINGSSSAVSYVLDETATADAMDAAAESREDGEWIYGAQFVAEGDDSGIHYMKIYKNEAPDSVDSDELYAVYDTTSSELQINSGSTFADDTELDVTGVVGESYSFTEVYQNFGISSAVTELIGGMF